MVVYICGSDIRYKEFPKKFQLDLDEHIKKGDEILLGDSGFALWVLKICRANQYENVRVFETAMLSKAKPHTHLERSLKSVTEMIEKCNEMEVVWDGESCESLINMLLLLALHKECLLYYLPLAKCFRINNTDDLGQFVRAKEGWKEKDIRYVLEQCGFEEQMISYTLASGIPGEKLITEIICKAPVPLKVKSELIDGLCRKSNTNYEVYTKLSDLIKTGAGFNEVKKAVRDVAGISGVYLEDCSKQIQSAKNCLDSRGEYYLFKERYDTGLFMEISDPVGRFGSAEEALWYVKREGAARIEEGWYRLKVQALELLGSRVQYDFYIYNGEICWFKENVSSLYSQVFFNGPPDLSIPTPFKAGDIVSIDCRPFGPPFHAVVIEARDQFDCCMPQVLFKVPGTDKWSISALKHKGFYKDTKTRVYRPPLSPLYRLRQVRPREIGPADNLLACVSEAIDGSEGRGIALWNAWNDLNCEQMTEERLIDMVRLMVEST